MFLSLAVAVGIILSMLSSRRSLKEWQEYYTAENREWKQADEAGINFDPVTPAETDLKKIVDESTVGSGYMVAEDLVIPEKITRLSLKNSDSKWKEV